MKRILLSGLLVFALQATANDGPSGYNVTERGANHRVWQRTSTETGPNGRPVTVTHAYTELATGLNYRDENGQWVESSDQIELLPDGAGAVARHGQHKVNFPGDIAKGRIVMDTADGKSLRSQVMGLSYLDTASGKSVLIAQLKDSTGVLAASNVVMYPDAFTDFSADVRYTYTHAGFEQDVVLRQQPPSPADYGLDPATTHLQVLTEFFDPPTPRKQVQNFPGFRDESLDFGAMKMGHGKAFALGEETKEKVRDKREAVRVGKQWTKLEGRYFLIEEVEFKKVQPRLQELAPASAALSLKPASPVAALHQVVLGRLLPQPRPVVPTAHAFEVASRAVSDQPGYVLDYVTLSGATDFTFAADQTYYVSSSIYLYGTTTIEGGTVIKYAKSGSAGITVEAINCQTAPYRPGVMTAVDDNSVGEPIGISTNVPSGYYGGIALHLGPVDKLKYMRATYLDTAFFADYTDGGSDESDYYDFFGIQIANCRDGFYAGGIPIQVRMQNGLIYQVQNLTDNMDSGQFIGNNLTVHRCGYIIGGGNCGSPVCLTNCLLVLLTNYMNDVGCNEYFTNHVVRLTNESGIFQTVGSASHYLVTNSVYRDAGTTAISSQLLAALQAGTTYPPVVYSNATISTVLTLSPTAGRDTNAVDLGYHYDALDYAFGGCDVNTNLFFTAGTAVGWFHTSSGFFHAGHGIHIDDRQVVTFAGTALAPDYWVRANTVQEGNANWSGGYGAGGMTSWADQDGPYTNAAEVHAHYLRSTGLGGYDNAFRDDWGILIGRFRDCEFYSASAGAYVSTYCFTNCLFYRAGTGVTEGRDGNQFFLRNCTFYRGGFNLTPTVPVPIEVKDCSFDNTPIDIENDAANGAYATYDYNAYTDSSDPFPIGGSHDHSSFTFNWQTGPLGNFYLPSNSGIINAGSTTADLVDLYNYTTQTSQIPETNSIVDIGYHYVALDGNGQPLRIWRTTGLMSTGRYAHTATLLANGKVLVAGGYDGSFLTSAELYDPITRTWRPTGSMHYDHAWHTATLLQNGKVLVAGGLTANFLTAAELYDPASGTWSVTGALSTGRFESSATVLTNGRVLIEGGNTMSGITAGSELYNPASGTWTTVGALHQSRTDQESTLMTNGNVLVSGGFNGDATAEVYSSTGGTWSTTGAMHTSRYYHTADLLNNGKVMVAGGYDGTNDLATAEFYNTAAGTWATTGSMADEREGHASASLPDGRVMVVAGDNLLGILAECELYTPGTATWASIAVLNTPRYFHTATTLFNGDVLTVGGVDYNGDFLDASELWAP